MNERILIVDDDKKLVARYKEILEEAGYKIDTTYDGKEGLDRLKQQGVDLVILDLKMPKMDGVKVLENIRDDESLRKTKVLVISSYAYKMALKWWRDGSFRRIPQPTHLGSKAYQKGVAKAGGAGRIDIKSKPKLEMQEILHWRWKEKYLETIPGFQRRLKLNYC